MTLRWSISTPIFVTPVPNVQLVDSYM